MMTVEQIKLIHEILALAWGGGDGVIRGATETDLKVVATSPTSLAVTVGAGRAFISRGIYKLDRDINTLSVVPPSTLPRIDLVVARLADWSAIIVEGAEAIRPVPLVPRADEMVLAELYLRPKMTLIQDADDSLNGYISDVRLFV